MSTTETPIVTPNPFTPMAFLPPDIARQTAAASNVIVGTLAIMIWDILTHLTKDFQLLFKYEIRLPTVVYFVSRLGSLGYVLASAIFYTAPTGNCANFEKILDIFFPIAVSSSALLFFLRIRAIYDRNPFVTSVFFVLWLSVVAGTVLVPIGATGINIGPTDYCINFSAKPYVGAAGIIPLIHDTMVFLAVTIRLMANSHIDYSLRNGIKVALFGEYLPAFSKALLQDGQKYYLVTVVSNLLTVLLFYNTSIPVTYRTIFSAPNIMLINVMACQVYRHTKFGIFRETLKGITSSGDRRDAVIPLSLRTTTTNGGDFGGSSTLPELGITSRTQFSTQDYGPTSQYEKQSVYKKEYQLEGQ